jgi:hypothetical protein
MGHSVQIWILTAALLLLSSVAKEEDRPPPTANVGMLLECIQVDHAEANRLLHQFGDQPNAIALREELEKRLDSGAAELVESSYLASVPGERARVESLLEFIYPSEFDTGDFPTAVDPKKSPFAPFGAWAKYDVSPSALGLASFSTFFDIREVGTYFEFETTIGEGEALEINVAAVQTQYLGNRLVGDPRFAMNGTIKPTFHMTSFNTNFITKSGDDHLLAVLTPKNDSDQRIFLIIRANVLE